MVNTKYISGEHNRRIWGQGGIPLNLGQQKFWGKEEKSVAGIKNQPKCGTEMRQNVQNRLLITKHLLAVGAPEPDE